MSQLLLSANDLKITHRLAWTSPELAIATRKVSSETQKWCAKRLRANDKNYNEDKSFTPLDDELLLL